MAHGEYLPWVEANMPISRQQCSKYVRLATEKPELLANGKHAYHLDVDSELKLLSLDDEVAEEVRDFAQENDLTRKEIAELTKQLKSKETESEQLTQTAERGFKSLKDCLTTPINKGGVGIALDKVKTLLYYNPMYKHKADDLSKRLGIVELAKNTGVLNANGVKSSFDKIKNVRAAGEKGGNSAEYRIAKLKRDHPETAQRLMDGEFKNVAEAERAAGVGKAKLTPTQI